MARNILFIILFVLVYGFILLTGLRKPGQTPTDRTECGEFTATDEGGCRYVSELYGIDASFGPDWIVYDGIQSEKILRKNFSEAEIEDMYGCAMSDLAFAGGFVTPDASLDISIMKNDALPAESFASSYLDSIITYSRESVISGGGDWGGGSAYVVPAKGSGDKVLLYYYDYEYDGEFNSTFCAMMNVNGNIISLDGYYSSGKGQKLLVDFVKNRFGITTAGNIAV